MYDELVKRLRELASEQMFDFERQPYLQAADAIEKLSHDLDSMTEANTALYGALPKWIPVTERLPSVGDKVIVAIRDESGDTRYDYTNTGWYSGNGYKWVVEDEYCSWVTHWMPLPSTEGLNET